MFFFASENQDSSKIQTENKTHQDEDLKINSICVMPNFSASKHRLNSQNPSTRSGDVTSGGRSRFPLC